jgi:hypothetical protein
VNSKRKQIQSEQVYVITGVANSTVSRRRKRYLQLMVLRVLLVPGVFLFDLPVGVQAGIVLAAAVSQFAAVIGANTPDYRELSNSNKTPFSTPNSSEGKEVDIVT